VDADSLELETNNILLPTPSLSGNEKGGQVINLYFIGAWYDSILIIEYTEVLLLGIIMTSGLIYFIKQLRMYWKGGVIW